MIDMLEKDQAVTAKMKLYNLDFTLDDLWCFLQSDSDESVSSPLHRKHDHEVEVTVESFLRAYLSFCDPNRAGKQLVVYLRNPSKKRMWTTVALSNRTSSWSVCK